MKRLFLLLWLPLACGLTAAEPEPKSVLPAKPLRPGEFDGAIGRTTAQLLERFHYLQHPLDDEIASRFFDRYLEALDPQKLLLLEPDVKEFEPLRTTLDDQLREADVSPAHLIFWRFMARLEQQHAYVKELLEKEGFKFDGNERFLVDRRNAPRPSNLAEARKLWRDRLRSEYLAEKLSREKKPGADSAKEGAKAEKPSAEDGKTPARPLHEEIVEFLSKRYSRAHDYFSKFDSDDVLQYYLSALTRAYDPHSDYMGHSEMENFNIGMRLSLFGIGAVLRDEDGYCTVLELKPGPAMKSGKIKPKDKIVAVAQGDADPVDVVGMKLSKVVEMIRGPKGTEVRLTVVPANASDSSERRVVSLIRDEIKLEDQEAKAKIIEMPASKDKTVRLGVIDLPSFYADLGGEDKPKEERKSTARDMAVLLNKLKQENVAGIVLDLRRNGGGSLEEAVKTTGLFIKEGPVVTVRDSLGRQHPDEDEDPSVLYDGPLIVLTSRFSASASEILAGALQDYGRALIVGESSTHGKGTVQTLLELGNYMRQVTPNLPFDPGSVKLTIRKFYLPSGASTQLKGITPDIILPSVNNHADVGEAELENPLPWDPIAAADYVKLNRVRPHLSELKKRSEARVAASKDFSYVREDIERYKQLKADRTVSLNEEQRRREKQEIEARLEARRKEIQARAGTGPKTWQFTLAEAKQPGLPAAGGGTNLAHVATTKSAAGESTAKRDDTQSGDEDRGPEVDAPLNESLHILLDLLDLMGKPVVAASE